MGGYLSQPVTTKAVETDKDTRFEYAAVSMQGWRTEMEDAHIASLNFDGPDKAIFGVFDGHGGKEVALYVKKQFIPELLKDKDYQEGRYKTALENTFLKMDQLIATQEVKDEINNSNAGCTANVVLIVQDTIYCANSGDSRSVVSDKGIVSPLSEDHKPENEIELTRVRKAGGEVIQGRVNGNLNLSRALGDLEYKVNENGGTDPKTFMITAFPDVSERDFSSDISLIILGCDGIWECRSNQEIVDYFKEQNVVLKDQCAKFLDSILAASANGTHSGLDNMSLIVVRVSKQGDKMEIEENLETKGKKEEKLETKGGKEELQTKGKKEEKQETKGKKEEKAQTQ